NFGFDSDSRKRVSISNFLNYATSKPSSWNANGSFSVNYKPTSSITLSTGPNVNRSRGNAQFVTSVTDPTATRTYGGRYVFADIDQSSVAMTTRVNWILSPKISLQIYTQPLISVGRYWDFKELAQPASFSFSRYG